MHPVWATLLLSALCAYSISSNPFTLRLAAVLDDPMECSRGERLAITLAKEGINHVSNLSVMGKVEVDIFELLRDSEYETGDTMCQIISKGVLAVLGPFASPASDSVISNICGEKEVPYVRVAPEDMLRARFPRFSPLDLHPTNTHISLAVVALLSFFNSTSACLLCARVDCLMNLEQLLRQFLISKETLTVRMLDDSQDPTPVLKEIRNDQADTIIVDASVTVSHLILERASELGMLSVYYTYIFTTMEFSLLQLDDILVERYVNILGFSVLNHSHPYFSDLLLSLNRSWQENCEHAPFPGVPLSPALLYDAVHVVVSAVRELNCSQSVGATQLTCQSPKIWEHGTSLMNYLRMVELEGLTGHIEFNSKGRRFNYTLRVLHSSSEGLKQLGEWHSEHGLSMESDVHLLNVAGSVFNATLTITTILENPYVMLRPDHQALAGNERYEGFCVDMLRELAQHLHFSYRLQLVADGMYGTPGPNGTWTGMVGELISRKADLAIAGLTITSEREKVIDFSKPFMTLGISIMYTAHMTRQPSYWSFLDPFSPGVWLFMLLAYLMVSCVLFLVARLTPYEWCSSEPCLQGRCKLVLNQYTLGNSLWFPVGGIMQQGTAISPHALSTRCLSTVWWFFTLIIVSSYTANMAAFLTIQRMEVPIDSVDDLADQTTIEYGTMQGGSTMNFFQNSQYETYQRMWNFMHAKQNSVFVTSTEEGINRVLNSNYAYLLESTMSEYYRQRNCNLTQIGGLLDTKGYGIGMPLGSVYRDEIDMAILKLQEDNRLEMLKRKWWLEDKCSKEEAHPTQGLGMENIGGVFVVLLSGLLLAVFMAGLEFAWVQQHTRGLRLSMFTDMLRALHWILLCENSIALQGLRGPGTLLQAHPPLPGECMPGSATCSLSNGMVRRMENSSSDPMDPLSHRPEQEAILAPLGCTHVRICPECRGYKGLRMRPPPTREYLPELREENV
ncbi:glutamate receptor ionotropic, kainate 4 isoform X1 [Esox lucius]|uniref:glutamate receptor ionotropic, kainate 4 isoform X1 n=1 Tax=Esox lucius TaxID=8010 RepID=UPI0005760E8D|nr:glutamate receptor ionotropic, kainate 4 isoform X1 [Esox lucius]